MSSFALKGFVTGLAKGVATGLDEERESTRKNLAFQMKSSYENMQKYNESVAAMKKDIMERDQRLLQFDPSLTEEQRIAAATMPDLLNVYQNLLNQGTKVRLGDLITVGERAKGGNFNTWISNLGQLEKAADTTGFVVDKKDSFFAPSATAQQRMVAEMSSALGADAQQLARFKTTPDLPSLGSYGGFTKETIDKLRNVPSLSQQLQDAIGKVGELTLEYGKDSDQVKEASITVEKLKGVEDKFTDPKEQSWTARLDSLNLKLLGERDPAKRASLQAQIKEWVSINELSQKTDNPIVKPLTYSQYYSQWSKAANTYFASNYGSEFLKKNILQTPDGKYDWVGDDPKIKERTQKEMKMIALSSLRQYITNGKPINLELQNFLENIVGVQFLTPQQVEEYRKTYNSEKGTNISTEEATQQLVDSGRMISITGR